MRYAVSLLIVLFLFSGCSKKDILHPGANACQVVKFQGYGDSRYPLQFYEKTFDARGLVTHVRTWLREEFGNITEFDYQITYLNLTTAKLTGRRRVLQPWDAEGNPISTPIEVEKDESTIEAKFDPNTHLFQKFTNANSGVLNLEFVYTNGRLSRINTTNGFFNVVLDNKKNILSIRTPFLAGLSYTYSNKGAGKNLVYEPSEGNVNQWYHLVEVLNWGPLQPNRERATLTTSYGKSPDDPNSEEYNVQHFTYYTKFDNKGNLTGISFDPKWVTYFTNTYNCKSATVNSK